LSIISRLTCRPHSREALDLALSEGRVRRLADLPFQWDFPRFPGGPDFFTQPFADSPHLSLWWTNY
jgi:hypothetical protein